jgi:hypothetical protein
MSGASYMAFFGLVVMVVLYAIDRWWLAPLGFSAASAIVAGSEFVLARWPLGLAATLGFAIVASRRWRVRAGRSSASNVVLAYRCARLLRFVPWRTCLKNGLVSLRRTLSITRINRLPRGG